MVAQADAAQLDRLTRLKIDAQLEFATAFPGDARAPAVQTDAANSLFELERYQVAMDVARDSLERWPAQTQDERKTNLLILGHGAFELAQFAGAESAYQSLLLMPLPAAESDPIRERLLATVYKQGELAETAGDLLDATGHYLRLRSIDPSADLTAKGHFDAVAALEGAGELNRAAALLRDFRDLYPDHELGKGIDLRLASLFEKDENYREAAAEFVNVAERSKDTEVRRQSLYRAAELYEQMQDLAAAQRYYTQYVEAYPKPYAAALEAVQKLDEFAVSIADTPGRERWLEKKIAIHKSMGRGATERAGFLAAEAALYFADRARERFAAVRLTHPLPKSLKTKTKALKETVKAYERVADYKVAQFASASTYRIADLYAALSRDIMASDRPSGLSELELEQYEILLEEQAFPFEEQAIAIHEINMRRSWEGVYDDWVRKSFTALSTLMPARFDKQEKQVAYVESIY